MRLSRCADGLGRPPLAAVGARHGEDERLDRVGEARKDELPRTPCGVGVYGPQDPRFRRELRGEDRAVPDRVGGAELAEVEAVELPEVGLKLLRVVGDDLGERD